MILDGGPCRIGLESTVIGFDQGKPVLLRKGAIAREEIERIIGTVAEPIGDGIRSPGQLESHYTPRANLRLNARDVRNNEALLAFGPDVPPGAGAMQNLSPRGDLREAAANFFAMLRALDRVEMPTIAVMPIPNVGIGEAINDRLRRASASRA
jgi:L-threonylcarbamoyladenylate synthase